MEYGPTIENLNLLADKAKNKKDGVYLFRGLVYRVKANHVTHFAYRGEILQRAGNFNVSVGAYDGYEHTAKSLLKKL